MFYQLVIDAIGEICYIYLLFEFKILDTLEFLNEKNLSINLMDKVKYLFEKHNIDYKVISNIFWVYGPGKFSSARIVSTFVKTIKLVSPNMQLHTIDKFEYLAKDNKNLVILKSDAKKYFICFTNLGKKISDPILVDEQKINEIVNIPNQEYELVFDNDNKDNLINALSRFKIIDENYELEYFKPPC